MARKNSGRGSLRSSLPDNWDWGILSNRVQRHPNMPLEGHALFAILHVLDDLEPLLRAFCDLGLDPADLTVVGIPYSSLESAAQTIRSTVGCNVELMPMFPFDSFVTTHLYTAVQSAKTRGKKLILLEDGGYATPALWQLHYMGLVSDDTVIGGVEQTTRGARIHKELELMDRLLAPMISIPSCSTKETIEPPYIALAVRRNIESLLNIVDPDRGVSGIATLGIFGIGAIGEHVARRMESHNALARFKDLTPNDATRVTSSTEWLN